MDFIQDLVIIFGVSVGVVLLFQRVYLPSIAGFLMAGALIGPYGLNLIDDRNRVEVLAEVGVILLLFTMGLEFSLTRLSRIRGLVLWGGALQVGVMIVVVTVAGVWLELPLSRAVFWGFLLALSSTVIVLKILTDRGELDSPQGRLAVGVLIFQDLIVVAMMLVTPVLADEARRDTLQIVWTLVRSFMIVGGLLVGAYWLLPRLLGLVAGERNQELFVITLILICAGMAWLAEENGLSLALGAFIAGLVISESEYNHQALADIIPFRDSFISLFFVSIGMFLDLGFFFERPMLILGLTILILVLKAVVAGATALVLGFSMRVALLAGLSLCQVGEFSFILAQAGQVHGLLSPRTYQLFLMLSILSMLLTPALIQMGPRLSRQTGRLGERVLFLTALGRRSSMQPKGVKFKGHVIIAGYGLNGRNLAHVLKDVGIPYLIVEINAQTVRAARALGEPIYYGDVTRREVLRQAGVRDARVLVLALSDPFAARRAVRIARLANPRIQVVVRTRYVEEVDGLFRLGADHVVPEEFETSLEIFDLVLREYRTPVSQILKKKEEMRRAGYAKLRREERQQGHAEAEDG